jgi:ketosteroid isomerase-like protein
MMNWQKQADGSWKIIFDRGGPHCEPSAQPTP